MPRGVFIRTEETRRKMSEAHKGKPSGMLGKHFSEETKRKKSLAMIGKNKGIKRSEEFKKNLSRILKGRPSNTKGKHWKVSEEGRKNISEGHKGSKSYLWKGGITPINYAIRNSFEYKEWRRKVFERDSYTCQNCGIKSGNGKAIILHADHIKSFALFPNLRFQLSNGRTLCKDCHKQTDTYLWKIKKISEVLKLK